MRKSVAGIIFLSFFITAIPQAAFTTPNNGAARELLQTVSIDDHNNAAEIAFIEVRPNKVAALVSFSKKSEAKIKKIELVSPTGVRYVATGARQVDSAALGTYLDSISVAMAQKKSFLAGLDSLITPEAYANSGQCGQGGGAEQSASSERGSGGASGAAMLGLLSTTSGKRWFAAMVFSAIMYEYGFWDINLLCDDGGKSVRLKAKSDLFSEHLKKHQGLTHKAGVTQGGTFIQVNEPAPASQPAADSTLPAGTSYDPDTGVTVNAQGNPDGSRTVTKTDADGNVISKETVPKDK
jgi:hypothetical protein